MSIFFEQIGQKGKKKMRLEYIVANPTGNITLLITTPVVEGDRARVAGRLMEREPAAEQAGFLRVTEGGAGLDMAGGEFCGNATMCAAAEFLRERGVGAGARERVTVQVSGVAEAVTAEAEVLEDGSFWCTVEMPAPAPPQIRRFTIDGREYELPLVRLPGIAHVVVPGGMPRGTAERAVRKWCGETGAAALGLMLLDEAAGRLEPLVYVPGAETTVWESSCASGTTAAGAWLSRRDGRPRSLRLSEPGGVLSVHADFAGGVFRLGGHVRLGERKIVETVEK